MSSSRTVFVDGYNVIRRTPQLAQAERRSLQHGRDTLITMLAARYGRLPHRIVVVFDGDGVAESAETRQGLRVVFSAAHQTADEVIIRLSQEARARGESVVVATDDGGLRAALGNIVADAQHHSATELGRDLHAAPRWVEKAYRHRMAVKRHLEADTDEERPASRQKGNPRRAPKKR